jgi:hypothetical protein
VFTRPALDYSDYRSVQKYIDLTQKKEQHFECLWLCYSLAESRIFEARTVLGLEAVAEVGLNQLHSSVEELLALESDDAPLKIAFGDHLLQQLSGWLYEAKSFFSQFAQGAKSTEHLHSMLTKLVREGRRLTRQLSTAVRVLKRNAMSVAR